MIQRLILLLLLTLSNAYAVIDAQIMTKPNQAFMNFFLEGYLPWHEKNFGMRPQLGSRSGDEFLKEVFRNINHWRTPEHPLLDQFLIGQGFDEKAKPYYTFRVYIAKNLRNHSYLKSFNLPFEPLFIEKNDKDGLCFLAEIKVNEISWKSVPRFENSYYLKHYCNQKLKYISLISKHESFKFPNPFGGQADYEIQTFSPEKLVLIFQYIKTTHTGLLLPQHIPYINQHGKETLLPFDKISVNEKGEMVIYYP